MRHIEDLIAALDMSNCEFANMLGITPSAVSDMIHGRVKKISGSVSRLIEYKYNVNPEWLHSGEGEMFLRVETSPEKNAAAVRPPAFPEPTSDDECIRLFQSLPDDDRKEIRSFVGWRAALRGISAPGSQRVGSDDTDTPYSSVSEPETDIPLLNRIITGSHLFSCDNTQRTIRLPRLISTAHGNRRLFAMQVDRDSMSVEGIRNGDYAIFSEIKSHIDEIADGNIVAAVINDELTLARVHIENGAIILKVGEDPSESVECPQNDECRVIGSLAVTLRRWLK